MSNNDPTRGLDLDKQPHKSIIKRIDIGLMTGICALLISFIGILTSRATFKMNQETQKIRVLPIIKIDMGYLEKPSTRGTLHPHFEVTLNNVGAGLAHIQEILPLQNNEVIKDIKTLEAAIMTPRLRSWAKVTEKSATGYLRAGNSITPLSYNMGAPGTVLSTYLRGEDAKPLDGVDVKVCYCSIFDECWTVRYLDRKTPKPVRSCKISDIPNDGFDIMRQSRLLDAQN